MIERGPIQSQVPGLLGLLQLKVDGRGVPKLGDVCIPSLEMLPFWLRGAASHWPASFTTGATAAGAVRAFVPFSTQPITVPNGEWWYVFDYAVAFSTAGGDTATRVRLAWSPAPSMFSGFVDSPPFDLAISSEILVVSQGFWLPPGSRLGYYADTVAGAGGLSSSVRQLRYTVCKS